MTIDLTPRYKDFAVYLPALQNQYAAAVKSDSARDKSRPFPPNLKMTDLDFLNPKSKLWHYGYGLYSAGQFSDLNSKPCAVTNRDREKTIILGDSGGYQIGKGTLGATKNFSKAKTSADVCEMWRKSKDIPRWIVNWLETHSDYAMTIDMPLWARFPSNSKTPFHKCSIEELIELSVENLEFIKFNKRGNTKWLNVLQGTDAKDSMQWWNAVKKYKLSGWALAGSVGWRGIKENKELGMEAVSGLENVLRFIMLIRDENGFSKQQEWLHVLGVSQPIWAVLLSQIQRSIRKHCKNPNFRVSYDSASPFQMGGRYQQVVRSPKFGKRLDSWTMSTNEAPINPMYAKDKQRYQFPYASPIGDLMSNNELNWNGQFNKKVPVDSIGGHMLTNHNLFVFVRSMLEANELAFMHSSEADKAVPQPLIDCIAFIEDLFGESNWEKRLKSEKKLIDSLFSNSTKLVTENFKTYDEEEVRFE